MRTMKRIIIKGHEIPGNTLWFVIAFIFGSILIWGFKAQFDSLEQQWYPAILATGIVVILAIYYILYDYGEHNEKGDNVYYLGLSFTLVSLMFTLVELFAGEGDRRADVETQIIIENFGIALLSTIAGIICRILVQNLQINERSNEVLEDKRNQEITLEISNVTTTSTDEEIYKANRELVLAINRELQTILNGFASFHRTLLAHAEEMENRLDAHLDRLVQTSEKFAENLNSKSIEFGEVSQEQFLAISKKFDMGLTKSVANLNQYFDRIRDSQNQILQEYRTFVGTFEVNFAKSQQTQIAGFQESSNEIRNVTRQFVGSVGSIANTVSDVVSNLKLISNSMEESGNMGSSISAIVDQTVEMHAQLRLSVEEFSKTIDEVRNISNASAEIFESQSLLNSYSQRAEVGEKVSSSLEVLNNRIQLIADSAELTNKRLNQTVQSFSDLAEIVSTNSYRLSGMSQEMLEIVIEMSKIMVEIKEKLGSKGLFSFLSKGL